MPPADRPLLIGLTGGIAAGKTTVASLLQQEGLRVVQADSVAHEALRREDVCLELARRFGSGILRDGVVDRKRLGDIVFEDGTARHDLNAIVHPHVLRRLDEIVAASKDKVLLIEIPLLFESGLANRFDVTITVEADRDKRLSALMRRDGLDRHQAKARLQAQLDEDERIRRADRVLRNPMTPDGLADEVKSLRQWLAEMRRAGVPPLNLTHFL
ncbi:MAG: dephospho-CoA kinase [Candidatus Cloacimonetes bacterium]|nr:dephospho-CoA kinase [Candidatus Cloacimonadota bacterium]